MVIKKSDCIIRFISKFITPGLCLFIIFILLNILVNKGRCLYENDDFSHWGRATLNMYKWNKFGNSVRPITLFYPGYPPGASLWGYFFESLKSTFSESYLFAAQNILSFSFMIIVYKKINWKNWKKAIFLMFVLILFPLVFYTDFWSSIYVDGLLGIWLFYILYNYFSENENTVFKVFKICLSLGTFPLLKATGTGLAFLAILIIAVHMFGSVKSKNECKKKLCIILAYVMSVLIGKESWILYLKLVGVTRVSSKSTVELRNIIGLLKGNAEPYQYEIIHNFLNRFFRMGGFGSGKFTAFDWILIIIILSITMYFFRIWNRKEVFYFGTCFILCIGIYAASLLMLYCFSFGEYEGIRLASYNRYMGSILLGIIGFIVYTLVSEAHGTTEKVLITAVISIMIPFGSIENYTVNLNEYKQERISERSPFENIKGFADFMDWKKDKVYFVYQGSNGYENAIGSYNAIPVVCGMEWGWSLGPALYEGDIWTVDYSLDEWEDKLLKGEYTYVYIAHKDEQFIKIYSDIFENSKEIEDRALYKVYKEKGRILLKLARQY